MTRWLLPILALPLLAAAPHKRQLGLFVPHGEGPLFAPSPAPAPRPSRYAPAPLPDRDVTGPRAPRASTEPDVRPSLFTRTDQYRGEGFSPNSTAQIEQERRVHPGAGISLHMPLTGK